MLFAADHVAVSVIQWLLAAVAEAFRGDLP
jgi:hypothetical protein